MISFKAKPPPSVVIAGATFRRSLSSLPVNLQTLSSQETHAAIVKQHLSAPADESKMNAPNTFPTAVDTTRAPGVSTGRHYMNLGKSLVKLYKAGIVNVWRNNWRVRGLQKEYSFKNEPALTKHILEASFAQNIEKDNSPVAPSPSHISRADYQTVLRTQQDFKKLPLFAVVFAVFFEMTPLLVLAFPRITPSTCSLPYQVTKDHTRANRDIELIRQLHKDGHVSNASSVYQLGVVELQTLAKVLFHAEMTPVSFYPRKVLEQKVQAHIDRVRADNILIGRFGSVWAMEKQELVNACLSRAISTQDRTVDQMRSDLFLWITNFGEGKFDAGFFFFPVSSTTQLAQKVLAASN